jgi:regulator of sigma E protease
MLHLALSLGAFALVLGVLVTIHELGHYLAARACGVRVEAFSIGFGPTLVARTARSGTVWKISAFPLGGYVKMHGMTAPGEGEPSADPDSYTAKPVASRMAIAAAGPLANVVLAFVLFTGILLCAGREVPLAVVGQVLPGSAAEAAGMKTDDRIAAIGGMPIRTFEELREVVTTSPGKKLGFDVERGKSKMFMVLAPKLESGEGRIGILSGRSMHESLGPLAAARMGAAHTAEVLESTAAGIGRLLTQGEGAKDVGGPILIAQVSGEAASYGLAALVAFMGMLSVNLAVVNLLPIPILDGGHLVFLAAEGVLGRPVSARAQDYAYRLGFAVLASAFVVVSFRDVLRLLGDLH